MADKGDKNSKRLSTWLILKVFGYLPLGVRKSFFTVLAVIYYHLFPRHRLIAIHNLKTSFPEKDMAEIIMLARKAYRNIAVVAAEFFDIPRLNRDNIVNRVEVVGLENCEKALKKGKGLLLSSAHFGNWELAAAALSLFVRPAFVLYRPLDNAFLDDLVFRVRSSTGNTPLPKKRAMRQMLSILSKNEIICIIIDQNVAWKEGVFVDFFRRPACTTDGIAQLALRTGAPVIPGFLLRVKDGKYRLIAGEEIKVVNTGNWDSDVVINTQNFTRAIEEMVRAHPDQWLWLHHRWKTKPWQVEQ